jgi:hypothetical protein
MCVFSLIISNVVRSIARDYHFQSFKEYRALLTFYNISVEEVRGEIKGKEYKGLIYSALNEKGEKTGNPFKSSLFGKSAGMEALEKRFEKSVEIIKQKGLKERNKQVITTAIRATNTRADFENALEKQGMTVLFRTNDEGRIYGATFIDYEQKYVFNGSRLGKDFSANVFNEKFSLNNTFSDNYTMKQETEFPNHENQKNQDNQGIDFSGIFAFLSPSGSAGDDYEEKAFLRRTKKKKKHQRRM